MSEVKRYQAVHIRYEDSNIRYGEGCEVDMVTASDFDKQAQEIERLNATVEGLDRQNDYLAAELSQLKSRQSGVVLPEQWSKSFQECWPVEEDDRDGDWAVGAVMRDGDEIYCPVITVEAAQYDAPGESEKIARALVALLNPVEQLKQPSAGVDEREAVEVVGAAILGGLFHGGSGPELGDIDVELNPDVLERIQQKAVTSSDDVMLPLMTVAQHERLMQARAQLAAPPAIPATQVIVERELLDLCYSAVHALCGMKIDGYTESKCKELRAILSSKGDV